MHMAVAVLRGAVHPLCFESAVLMRQHELQDPYGPIDLGS